MFKMNEKNKQTNEESSKQTKQKQKENVLSKGNIVAIESIKTTSI